MTKYSAKARRAIGEAAGRGIFKDDEVKPAKTWSDADWKFAISSESFELNMQGVKDAGYRGLDPGGNVSKNRLRSFLCETKKTESALQMRILSNEETFKFFAKECKEVLGIEITKDVDIVEIEPIYNSVIRLRAKAKKIVAAASKKESAKTGK